MRVHIFFDWIGHRVLMVSESPWSFLSISWAVVIVMILLLVIVMMVVLIVVVLLMMMVVLVISCGDSSDGRSGCYCSCLLAFFIELSTAYITSDALLAKGDAGRTKKNVKNTVSNLVPS